MNLKTSLQAFAAIILAAVSLSTTSVSAATTAQPSEGIDALKSVLGSCYTADPASFGRGAKLRVNGHPLNAAETGNVAWIKSCVVPYLPGTPEERVRMAARVTWWSLREGVLELAGRRAFRYSLCHESGRDVSRSNAPLFSCPTNIWQVGIAAGQPGNYSTAQYQAKAHLVAGEISPKVDESALLSWTASLAGIPSGTRLHDRVVRSQGRVRRSWLLRNPLIGFLLVHDQEVVKECLIQHKKWCTGSSYDEAKKFARNSAAMRQAIADLEAIFSERGANGS